MTRRSQLWVRAFQTDETEKEIKEERLKGKRGRGTRRIWRARQGSMAYSLAGCGNEHGPDFKHTRNPIKTCKLRIYQTYLRRIVCRGDWPRTLPKRGSDSF